MWESRVVREISKRLWTAFCDVQRRGISIAAGGAPPDAPAVPRRRKVARDAINPPQFHMHEPDEPIAARGFRQANQLTAHRFTHKHELTVPLNLARLFDSTDLVRRVIPRVLQARRVGPG